MDKMLLNVIQEETCKQLYMHLQDSNSDKYVMRPRGISLKSNMRHFQFSTSLEYSFGELHFAENPA